MSKFVKPLISLAAVVVGTVLGGPIGAAIAAFLVTVTTTLLTPRQRTGDRAASAATLSIGEVPREAWFGLGLNGGSLVDAFNYGGADGTDWEVLVIALADHRCDGLVGFFVRDQYVAYTGDGAVAGFNGQLQVFFRPGTETQTVPAILTSYGPGWTANDNGAGVCHVVAAYKADKADAKHPVWPSGRPSFQWLLRGKRCYQARKDSSVGGSGSHRWSDPATWEWSDNPIDCHYNFARGVYACDRVTDPGSLLIGRGLSTIEAPPANVFAPAAVCDEIVALDAGGSEKRYRAHGQIKADDTFLEVAEHFAAACGGVIHQPEGAVEIEPGQAKAATFYFSDDDLIVGSSVKFSEELDDGSGEWVNTVVPRFLDPAQRYAEFAAPVRRVGADLIADGGPREQTLTLSMVTSGTQAGRVGEIARRLGRLRRRATVTLGPRFAEVEEGDWGVWTSQRYLDGGSITFRVDAFSSDAKWHHTLQLREISAAVYAKDADAASSAVALQQNAPAISAPGAGAWAVAAASLAGVPGLVITGATDNDYAELVRFEYWISDGVTPPASVTTWADAGVAGPDALRKEIAGLPATTSVYAAVSYLVGGVPGPRRVLGPVTTPATELSAVEDRIAALASDSVLSAGSEKAQAIIDFDALKADRDSLDARYAALGSPGDLTAPRTAAVLSVSYLNDYLVSLGPIGWADQSGDTPIVQATWRAKWSDAYAQVAAFRAAITGRKGDSAYVFTLTNENATVPADPAGNVTSYATTATTVQVFYGSQDVTGSFGPVESPSNPQGLSVTGAYPNYYVNAGFDASEDTASFTFRMVGSGAHAGVTLDKVMTLTKSKAPTKGADAPLLSLSASSVVLKLNADGSIPAGTPNFTFTAVRQNYSGAVTFSFVPGHSTSASGVTVSGDTMTVTPARMQAMLAYDIANGLGPQVKVVVTGGGLSDSQSVNLVQDGANGQSPATFELSTYAINLQATSDGLLKPGQLPRTIRATVSRDDADITGSAAITADGDPDAYDPTSISSDGVITIGSSASAGQSIAPGGLTVSATLSGQPVGTPKRVTITVTKDAPPAASPSSGTAVVDYTISNTSYAGPSGNIITLRANGSGQLMVAMSATYGAEQPATGARSVQFAAMAAYRAAGSGGWSYLGSGTGGAEAVGPVATTAASGFDVQYRTLVSNVTLTGLTPNAFYDVGGAFRRVGGSSVGPFFSGGYSVTQ